MPAARSLQSRFLVATAVAAIVLVGLGMRIAWMNERSLWCDEAESAINALSIQETGLPYWKYLGLPVYENTLTEEWVDHPEYEFRDSSYSKKQGVVVYHGWLPIYSIAASQWLFGMRPDAVVEPPRVQHGVDQIWWRTFVPRFPALVFSVACMVLTFVLGCRLAGLPVGFAALTLMAFNAKTVEFGFQARYYSLTLLANVIAALALLAVVRRGRWRDFLFLGLAQAILFHTHLFSALVFTGVALLCVPWIVRHPGWLLKSIVGGALSTALVVPWILLSGFLETASTVPKANRLFASGWDWLAYSLDRPDQLLLVALVVALALLFRLRPGLIPGRARAALRAHWRIYLVLFGWMAVAYLAFHLIVPAASFFYERLSLVLWLPYVLTVSLACGDALRLLRLPYRSLLAVAAMLLLLTVRSRLVFFERPMLSTHFPAIQEIVSALQDRTFAAGTRFYTNPSNQLVFTYYTGLPIQSIAPVRREFLAQFPGPIVYIEQQMDFVWPEIDWLQEAARSAGRTATPAEINLFLREIWIEQVTDDIQARYGVRVPPRPALPDFLYATRARTRYASADYRLEAVKNLRTLPIFRAVETGSVKDLWLAFFYRFVNPEDRIGPRLNILPRLDEATVEFLPYSGNVMFLIPPARESNESD